MKKSASLLTFAAIFCTATLFSTQAHAQVNLIELILANPKVQALLGKPTELTNALRLCDTPRYKAANAQVCTEANQAAMVNRLPFEMRTVMSNSKSAQSLRDLCLSAQATPQRESYLCNELARADSSFAGTLQQTRRDIDTQGGANASN